MATRVPRLVSGPVPPDFIAAWNEMADRYEALQARVEALERGGAGLAPIVLAKSGSSGLAAATNATTPRKGTATLQVFDGTTLKDGPQVEYWNMATGTNGAIGGSKTLQLVRAFGKHLFANWESCT